jgi:uncharacterized protein YwgA
LASEVPTRYEALILTLAYAGLRIGEAAALRARSVDLMKRRIHIVEAASEVDGLRIVGETKTRQKRTVSIPPFLRDVLASHLVSFADRGSWAGEMHIQKAVFLLQDLTGVPTDYEFVLHHYGPFSYELREELNMMRGEELIDLTPRPYPYGPSFRTTDAAVHLEERFSKTLARYEAQINFVVSLVRNRSAADLERLATAAYLVNEQPEAEDRALAERLHSIKPHVAVESAMPAIKEIREASDSAPRVPEPMSH